MMYRCDMKSSSTLESMSVCNGLISGFAAISTSISIYLRFKVLTRLNFSTKAAFMALESIFLSILGVYYSNPSR